MRPKPTMAALNVAAYDMRLFMPYGGTGTTWAAGGAGATQGSAPGAAAAGISSGGAHGSRASAAAGTGVSTGGGIPAAASSSAAAAGAHQQQASFTATPGFESGLIAECDCLLLGLVSASCASCYVPPCQVHGVCVARVGTPVPCPCQRALVLVVATQWFIVHGCFVVLTACLKELLLLPAP